MGDTGQWTGQGEAPTIASVVSMDPRTIRVTFSEPMQDTADLRDVSHYSIGEVGGAADVTPISITPGGGDNPTFIDIRTDVPMDWGYQNYKLSITTND